MKILLSIKPEYANRILDGSKKFEFRKRLFRNGDVHTVVIYATLPVGKVVGEFTIRRVHSERPDKLWRRTSRFSGISKAFFSEYFHGRDVGHAIEVNTAIRYAVPLDLGDVLASGVAPQSYAYVR